MILILQRKPDAAFDRFLDALQATGQEHVVNEIKGRNSGLPAGLELDHITLRRLIILPCDYPRCHTVAVGFLLPSTCEEFVNSLLLLSS